MERAKSILKKIKNINVKGLIDGIIAKGDGSMDDVAEVRSVICADCPSNVDEPIEAMQVSDGIESISNRMCDECGCSLPYKVRQEESTCPLKKW